jgi:hypothetical protein
VLAVFRQFGDHGFTAHILSYLGCTVHALGENLEFSQEIDYRFGSGLALDALGQVAYTQGNIKKYTRSS